MHEADSFAALGFVDHEDDSAEAGPLAFVATDFHNVCLCRTITIGGVECMAHSPSCEMEGHGCQTRFVSEQATTPANECGEGKRGRPGGHPLNSDTRRLKKGSISYWCKQGRCKFCTALNCGHDCHKEKA
jgi:hypothetical protein